MKNASASLVQYELSYDENLNSKDQASSHIFAIKVSFRAIKRFLEAPESCKPQLI